MMEIFYNEEDQQFYTIPDGDIATHKQIRDYYKTKTHINICNFRCNNAENNLDKIMEERLNGRISI